MKHQALPREHCRAFREAHERVLEEKILNLYSVSLRMRFAQPNIKDILRRAAALRSAIGIAMIAP